ncbi:uncharacterized protein TNCV_5117171 [Trichonephila clavipes]|nr:uncharacterized protein TNCV_5117171 [Trichonephila clavipes]
MPSPVQSNCYAHDTISNGQYGAVWSMGHTQQVCVRIVLLPSNVWQQFFGRSAFLRQQETDLTPAELCKDVEATAKGAVRTLVTEFKSVTCVQRCVRTEWNVDPTTSTSIHQWEIILKETGALVSQTDKYPEVFVIEDTVDHVRDSFCRSPDECY